MIKLTVSYPKSDDVTFDHDYYKNSHVPMCIDAFAPAKVELERGIDGPSVASVSFYFESSDAMKAAMDDRRRWTTFLDDATGYNSKQRGDKAKEWAKKASKAKSAVSAARHFMSMSETIPQDKVDQAEELISEIEEALESNENTKAAGRAEKLNKLFN